MNKNNNYKRTKIKINTNKNLYRLMQPYLLLIELNIIFSNLFKD